MNSQFREFLLTMNHNRKCKQKKNILLGRDFVYDNTTHLLKEQNIMSKEMIHQSFLRFSSSLLKANPFFIRK